MERDKKNLIFDLGGVIIDIHADAAFRAFSALGLPQTMLKENICIGNKTMQDYEMGKINSYEMFTYIASLLSPISQIFTADILRTKTEAAWCAMLGDIKKEKLQRIEQLRKNGHKIYLLSNTNEIHWHAIVKKFIGVDGKRPEEYFDKLFLSYRMGMIKPNAEIFRAVLDDIKADASDCLFIDDSEANCNAAEEAGICTIHVERNGTWTHPLFRE